MTLFPLVYNYSMDKKVIMIGGAVVLVLVLLVGGFLLMKKPAVTTSENQTETSEMVSPTGQPSSLRALLSSSVSQTCQYTDPASGTVSKVSISGGKMRGDFTTQVEGTTTQGHMYTDGKDMYFWTDGSTTGFKSSLETTVNPTGTTSAQSVDLDQNYDYNCSPALVDASLFVLPTGVKFTDFGVMLVPSISGSPESSDTKCSACDSLTGDTKVQCLQALGC